MKHLSSRLASSIFGTREFNSMIGLLVFAIFAAFLMGLRSISIFAVMIALVVLAAICIVLAGYKQAIAYVVLTQTSYVVGLFIIGVVRRRH